MADQIKVDIVAAYKDQAAKDAIKDAEKIEKLDPELTITADDKATPDIKKVTEEAEALDKADATVVLQAKVDVAQADLKAAKTALADLDGQTSTMVLDVDSSKAKKGMDDLHASTDKTNSVMANFAGNASQELPGVASALGPANTAIGQFAEGLAEGEINIAKMGTAAIGLAAASYAMKQMADHAAKIAAIKAFDDAKVKTFTEALKDGNTELDAIVKSLKEADKIQFAPLGQFKDLVIDLTPKMAELGVNVDTFALLVQASGDQTEASKAKLQAWSDEMIKAGTSTGDVGAILAAAKVQAEDFDKAAANAKISLKVFGDSAATAGPKVRNFSADTLEAKEAAKDATAEVAKFDAKIRLLQGTLSDELSWLNLKDSITQYTTDMWNAGAGTDAHREAVIKLQDEMLTYVAQLESVPEQTKTEIVADIMDEDWATAEAKLAALAPEEGIPARFKPYVDDQAAFQTADQLERMAKDKSVRFVPTTGGGKFFAAGGVGGGRAIVGEDGPELVDLPMGARVYPANVSAAMMHNQSAGTFTVNVNMPRGSRGVDVVRQIAGQARRSGRRYGTPVVHYARGRQFPGGGPH